MTRRLPLLVLKSARASRAEACRVEAEFDLLSHPMRGAVAFDIPDFDAICHLPAAVGKCYPCLAALMKALRHWYETGINQLPLDLSDDIERIAKSVGIPFPYELLETDDGREQSVVGAHCLGFEMRPPTGLDAADPAEFTAVYRVEEQEIGFWLFASPGQVPIIEMASPGRFDELPTSYREAIAHAVKAQLRLYGIRLV